MRRMWWLIISVMASACATQTLALDKTPPPPPPTGQVATATSGPVSATSAPSSAKFTPLPSATAQPTVTPTATAWVLPTLDAQAPGRRVRLPILMYHYIEPWPDDASDIRKGLTVRPDDFSAQIA